MELEEYEQPKYKNLFEPGDIVKPNGMSARNNERDGFKGIGVVVEPEGQEFDEIEDLAVWVQWDDGEVKDCWNAHLLKVENEWPKL